MARVLTTRRRKIALIVLAVLTLLISVVLYMRHVINSPATGTVLKPQNSRQGNPPTSKTLDTSYFSVQYPSRYHQQSVGQSASLGAWSLSAPPSVNADSQTLPPARINLIVTNLPSGGVTEDSSYKLFKSQPTLYTVSSGVYQGESVVVAKRADPYQQTVLWPHGNYLLTVNLLAGSEDEQLNDDLQMILNSIKWH